MVHIAFKHKATSFFGKIIKAWTLSPYCHCEIIFSDGQWFSARELHNAVNFVTGPPNGDRLTDYDFFLLPISKDDEQRIRAWCEKEQFNDDGTRCGYDVRGVLFSFLPIPIGWQSADKWFCSEICCAALQTIGWFAGYSAASVSPKKLYELTLKEISKHKNFKAKVEVLSGRCQRIQEAP